MKKKQIMIPRGIQMKPGTWTVIEKIARAQGISIGAVVRSMVNESIANKKLAQN